MCESFEEWWARNGQELVQKYEQIGAFGIGKRSWLAARISEADYAFVVRISSCAGSWVLRTKSWTGQFGF